MTLSVTVSRHYEQHIYLRVYNQQLLNEVEQNFRDLRDSDKSRYFAITELINCFIVRSPSLFSYFIPVYKGPYKFLQGQKLGRFHLAFSRDRWNCPSLGLQRSRSQTCAHSRSKLRPVPTVPCKRKVKPCKFLFVQTFVRTRVNGALVTS